MNHQKVHIGFDAKRLFFNNSGLGNYSRSIVRAVALNFPDSKISLFSPKGINADQNRLATEGYLSASECNNLSIFHPAITLPWWRIYGMGQMAKKCAVQVFHGLSNEIPSDLPRSIRKVCTIHDVIFREHPENYPLIDRTIYHSKVRHALKHSDVIIATSENTRNQILEYYPGNYDIKVIYQPVHPLFSQSLPESKKESTVPYLIYHSGFNHRKNHLRLLDAFGMVMHEIPHDLILAGFPGDAYDTVTKIAASTAFCGRVKIKASVNTHELVQLLRNASGFVYPSITEGFGIPLAEAASCGLNAAVSDIGVFNELSGDMMLNFDPLCTPAIADALIKLCNLSENEKVKQQQARNNILNKTNAANIALQLMNAYLG